MIRRWPFHALLLAVVLSIGFALYLPGLAGPTLLDDTVNLKEVSAYINGEKTAQHVIFDNRSGRLGRPISMASFVFDAWAFGDSTWHAKRSNLLIHLAIGSLIFVLLRMIFQRSLGLSRHAPALALGLAIIWLLLPIHVSTVLYLVQRMAQLSTLFMVAGLCWYMFARQAIENGQRMGIPALWVGLPVFTLLAAFSKENGILLPLLALVIELVWFRPGPRERRPGSVSLFFILSVLLPAIIGFLILLIRPDSLIGGYAGRDFSLLERVLTQSRVLWDYVFVTLLPMPANMGLFHDQYPISTGLLRPASTLLAIVAWLVVMLLGWIWRYRAPAFIGGLGLFLAGHVLESGIFPLEIYFEHRNYLPSIGLLLAVTGLVQLVLTSVKKPSPIFRYTLISLAVALPIIYLGSTHSRVQVWSSTESFYAQALRQQPESARLHSYLLGFALNNGDFFSAIRHIEAAEQAWNYPDLMAGANWRFLALCTIDEPPPDALYADFDARIGSRIRTVDMMSWEHLAQKIEAGDCPGVDIDRLSASAQRWLNASETSHQTTNMWRTRYSLARLLAASGDLEQAAEVGTRAWQDAGYNRGVGIFLFQVNASLGNEKVCRDILSRLERSEGQGDLRFDEAVRTFREALQTGFVNLPSASG